MAILASNDEVLDDSRLLGAPSYSRLLMFTGSPSSRSIDRRVSLARPCPPVSSSFLGNPTERQGQSSDSESPPPLQDTTDDEAYAVPLLDSTDDEDVPPGLLSSSDDESSSEEEGAVPTPRVSRRVSAGRSKTKKQVRKERGRILDSLCSSDSDVSSEEEKEKAPAAEIKVEVKEQVQVLDDCAYLL